VFAKALIDTLHCLKSDKKSFLFPSDESIAGMQDKEWQVNASTSKSDIDVNPPYSDLRDFVSYHNFTMSHDHLRAWTNSLPVTNHHFANLGSYSCHPTRYLLNMLIGNAQLL
jgi:hypothetical protein